MFVAGVAEWAELDRRRSGDRDSGLLAASSRFDHHTSRTLHSRWFPEISDRTRKTNLSTVAVTPISKTRQHLRHPPK